MKTKCLLALALTIITSSTLTACQTTYTVPMEPNVIGPVFSEEVESLRVISWLTGPHATTNTSSEWAVGGTDLGIPIYDESDGTMYFAFGDTYSGYAGDGAVRSNYWRSNVVGVTKDLDASDGIKFDSFLTNDGESAKQIIGRLQSDGIEVTNIPTGGIVIDGTMYMFHMSVRHWGPDGVWDINYGGCYKSVDKGETWSKVDDLIWTESDSTTVQFVTGLTKEETRSRLSNNFLQIFPVDGRDGYIYLYGIPGGRIGGAKLMRVKPENFEIFEEYEYFLGKDENNNPIFEKGLEARLAIHDNDVGYVIPPQIGEVSVMYNPYLGKWMTISQMGNRDVYYRTSPTPYGEWSNPVLLARDIEYPISYCGFMHEKYTEQNGKVVYFFMSRWDEYNVEVMRLEFR